MSRQRMLAVLQDGPLVADELLRRACPDRPRRQALDMLRRLVDAGLVRLEGKKRRTEIATALVMSAPPPAPAAVSSGAYRRKFVADPGAVSR